VIDRATHAWKELLEAYEPPPIDDAIRAELADYVARRKTEIGTAEIA
jgi:trimethylamine--corrinoid protein Co-methyltransferase